MTASVPDDPDDEAPVSHLLLRSKEILDQIPVEYRWEFTRRHPYYLEFWRPARQFRENPSTNPAERLLQQAASIILAAVNVASNVPPPDPRDGAETLGMENVSQAWQGGAVAPAMLRTLAVMLLVLPPDQRRQLGELFVESSSLGTNNPAEMEGILPRLLALPGDVWNSFPDVPIVSVNLQASQRAIVEAIETLVRQWKAERGITETRRRTDSIEGYLTVWDMREGWHDGDYHGDREQQFNEIAQELQVPVQTVVNRYSSAFRLLTGHDYSPELWIRLFGPLKLSQHLNPAANSRLARRRPWRRRNLRPVAEAVFLPGRGEADDPQFLQAVGITPSGIGLIDLQIDIQTLIERGDSDEQILRELADPEIPSAFIADQIRALRSHELG